MADIFLSYARQDQARIEPLERALEARGFSVFWDREIPAGETWRSFIGRELDEARCVVVAWSRDSVASEWVTEEADVAKERGLLVPVLLDDVSPPIGFRSVQAANLAGWKPGSDSERFEQLVGDIARVMGEGSRPAAAPFAATPGSTPASASPPLSRVVLPILAVLGIGAGAFAVYEGSGWGSAPTARTYFLALGTLTCHDSEGSGTDKVDEPILRIGGEKVWESTAFQCPGGVELGNRIRLDPKGSQIELIESDAWAGVDFGQVVLGTHWIAPPAHSDVLEFDDHDAHYTLGYEIIAE